MRPTRIGELLTRTARLSPLDVEEILEDQAATHRRFGEIALAWGLCQPEHVWHAWFSQLADQTPRVDLEHFGVDAQAVSTIPRELAVQYTAMPVRAWGEQVVIAATGDDAKRVAADLSGRVHKNVRAVVADAAQIRQAIETYYGAMKVPA